MPPFRALRRIAQASQRYLPRPLPVLSNVIRPLRRIANVAFRSDFS